MIQHQPNAAAKSLRRIREDIIPLDLGRTCCEIYPYTAARKILVITAKKWFISKIIMDKVINNDDMTITRSIDIQTCSGFILQIAPFDLEAVDGHIKPRPLHLDGATIGACRKCERDYRLIIQIATIEATIVAALQGERFRYHQALGKSFTAAHLDNITIRRRTDSL
ncbi:MAG: hypothetical protein ACLFTI_05440 [Anaerolineales bacterium]